MLLLKHLMKFKLKDIGEIADNFLTTLDSNRVLRFSDLVERRGQKITVNLNDFIDFDMKDHEAEGRVGYSYIASYCRVNGGIPIEFRVNSYAGFALVIVKAQEIIPGYTPFPNQLGDKFGNIYQSVENRQALEDIYLSSDKGFLWVIKELKKLKKLRG